MEFGFTNDKEHFLSVVSFRDAAINDGWEAEATYPKHEDISQASKLNKNGFVMMIITRITDPSQRYPSKWKYQASIHIWGPDGLAIIPPSEYSWDEIRAGLRICANCGREDVDTQRYSFAGRCCEECLPKMRELHEKPGWYN